MRDLAGQLAKTSLIAAAGLISLALHVGILSGLQQERGRAAAEFDETRARIDVNLVVGECLCAIPTPLPLPSDGWADLSCHVSRSGYPELCEWIRESEPGFGEAALRQLAHVDFVQAGSAERGEAIVFRFHIKAYPTA
jgi:hypothetical protein